MRLAWNAIVKNESAVIERCVRSLLPHVDGAVIVDTGSTDNTVSTIERLFDEAGKPVEIKQAVFENFEQARNKALYYARTSDVAWDYLLLADADMELRVKQSPWLNGEKGLSYDIRQVAGSLGYYNRRLVSRDAKGWYVGVTHEYLDVPTAGALDGVEFIDHADGANRPEKLSRDIALLEAALAVETRPGLIERYHFYLAGSYYDSGDFTKAASHYKVRANLGGFDEERWYAHMRYAQCLRHLGDQPGYLWGMLQAHQLRPHRAEVLHDLARHFRERGENANSLLFSDPALQVPYPRSDLLFVDGHVYASGVKEEFAISAYYDESKRARGAVICDELALKGSHQARSNLFWYLKPLVEHVPSARPVRIDLPLEAGWVAANPSVIYHDGHALAVVRSVNYTITPDGVYQILDQHGAVHPGNPIRTRNYLVRFSKSLEVDDWREIALPVGWPEPKYDMVRGFEDTRLFHWNRGLWTLSTVRELTPEGWCEQVLAPLTSQGYGPGWSVIRPKERRHEKNWMPWVRDGLLDFVYRLGVTMDLDGQMIEYRSGFDVGQISGSSQVIEVDGRFIALAHEAGFIPGRPHNRYYQHRFVSLARTGKLLGLSPPFVFHDRQIEFAAGLSYDFAHGKLIASYGVQDREAWLVEMDVMEVLDFIDRGHKP